MIAKIAKESAVALVLLSALSAFIEPRRMPVSIIVGGLLAILNIGGLSRGLESLLGTSKPAMKLLFLSIFRLFILSAIIVLLAVSGLVNLIALAAGFTVVLFFLVFEGARASRQRAGSD